jgi:hypothetical protein
MHHTAATMAHQVIFLHPEAPAKPPAGAACNGCGVCCASAPCPLGMWLSRRRHGACAALQWDEGGARYRCGALSRGGRLWQALARRWIAAGKGCDSTLQALG